MWNFIFSGMMVGLPAGIGVFLVLNKADGDKPSTGLMLVLYAAVLAGLFAYLLPDGKLLVANFKLKMPAVFVLGGAIGAVVGLLKRRRGTDKAKR